MKLTLNSICVPLGSMSLEINAVFSGYAVGIFGRSGSGKTTLLELIAGLKKSETAFIQLDDHILEDTKKGYHVPPQLRHIGYVPQDLALFPHFSVRQNLHYGLKLLTTKSSPILWDQVVTLLEIDGLMTRSILTLSGGEKQRVAFARALMTSPQLLLLDEPLASLNLALRKKILDYLLQLKHEFSIPMIYVSHDQMEIQALCDNVIVLDQGRIIDQGIPHDVFRRLETVLDEPTCHPKTHSGKKN